MRREFFSGLWYAMVFLLYGARSERGQSCLIGKALPQPITHYYIINTDHSNLRSLSCIKPHRTPADYLYWDLWCWNWRQIGSLQQVRSPEQQGCKVVNWKWYISSWWTVVASWMQGCQSGGDMTRVSHTTLWLMTGQQSGHWLSRVIM